MNRDISSEQGHTPGPWTPAPHPRGGGYALMNVEGKYERHPRLRYVLFYTCLADAQAAVRAKARGDK